MGPDRGGGAGSVDKDGIEDATAKHLLDSIGKIVHEQVKKEAAGRGGSELKGLLSLATFSSEETGETNDPCIFKYDELIKATDNNETCGKGKEDRFSVKEQAEYDNKKIRGNNGGACAPYRKLSLCNKNLETINIDKIDNKQKLLAEVCMAAKYEGNSIKTHYPKYEAIYEGSGHTTCTMLARSFADIGDIIRGRDLYGGNNKRRRKLEENLQKIFEKIHSGLTDGAKKHYKKDKDPDFFKLREDWWTANRETVWKAITCNAQGNTYFHATCDSSDKKGPSVAQKQCRCDGAKSANADQVPTYFDYVPQYLRWFEEWAEDFCRKKKKKVQNLQKQCRGEYQRDPRYCSRNGYDCEKTVNARGKVRMGKGCTDCFFACNPYVEWIEKQKEQFLKQRSKYTEEMEKYEKGASGSRNRKKRAAGSSGDSSNYDGYEKKFYEKLKNKGDYKDVEEFLKKLNDEAICKKNTDIEDGGNIDFKNVKSSSTSGDDSNKTFYRSEYCQPCPLCGVKKVNNGNGWEKKDDKCNIKLYEPIDGATPTEIKILKSGEGRKEIENKLNEFCDEKKSDKDSLYEEWKCYKHDEVQKVKREGEEEDDDEEDKEEVKKAGGLCILKIRNKKSDNDPDEIQKTFHDLFYYWVAHMLKDSIHWRTRRLRKCINDGTTIKCKDGCHGKCDCFQKWIKQKKKKEWDPIKKHFYTQKDICKPNSLMVFNHHYVLKTILEDEFYKEKSEDGSEEDSQSRDEDAQETKRIREIIEKKNQEEAASGVVVVPTCGEGADNEQKNAIDYLLKEELNDANNCLEKHKCQDPTKPPGDGAGRAAVPSQPPRDPSSPAGPVDPDDSSDEEDEEEEEEEEEGEEATAEVTDGDGSTTEKEVPGPSATKDEVNVCETVKKALGGKLDDACKQKYDGKYYGWKCIPSGDKAATGGATTGNDGAICIPPRRRRLYVGKLEEWASGQTTSPPPSHLRDADAALREAFIQSAAVETFFLWHKYKAENTKRQGVGAGAQPLSPVPGSGSDDPQSKLEKGEIPPDFLRQMFYTLGDYRDILYSGSNDTSDSKSTSNSNDIKNIVLEASGNTEEGKKDMKKIQQEIDKILKQSASKAGGKQTPSENPESWWKQHGKHIWKGMICALTYKDNDAKDQPPKQNNDVYNKFFGSTPDKHGTTGTSNGTYESTYKYDKVQLKEENSGEMKTNEDTNNQPTKLSDFVERPPYFRYLEEWGQNFCKERKKRLEEVRKACREKASGDPKYCSGDGHDCTDDKRKYNDMLADLYCPDCYEQCRKYRKWIDIKFDEYHKQEKKYQGEYDKLLKDNSNGGGDNNCCTEIKKKNSAAEFLESLKHCKDGQTGGEQGTEEEKNNKINFEEPLKTFGPLEYCKTCPFNRVNCDGNKRGRRGTNHCTPVNGNGNTWKEVFDGISGNGGKSSTIEVEMIDRRGPFIKNYSKDLENSQNSNDLFNASRLFKGIRNQNWTCKFNKDKNMDVCKLDKFHQKVDLNQYITFKVFLVYWLEDFLYGYYLLKKKIDQCTKKGEKTCDANSKNDCACVITWIEQKEKEWKQIKEHFNNRKEKEGDDDMKSSFKKVLEDLQHLTELDKIMKPCDGLDKFKDSLKCNGSNPSEEEDINKKDIIDCMIKDIQTKIGECTSQPSDKTQTTCDEKSPAPVEDDEEDLLLEEENTVEAPKICPPTTQQPEEPEGGCEPENEKKKEKEKEEQEERESGTGETSGATDDNVHQTVPEAAPSNDHTEEGAPDNEEQPLDPVPASEKKEEKKEKGPKPKPAPLPITSHPHFRQLLSASGFPWTVGIAFATFTYFFLKVLYIYINIYGCGCICICLDIYINIYMFVCICVFGYLCVRMFGYIFVYMYVFYIYFIYIYVFILKMKKMKKMKKRKKEYKKKIN